MDLIDSGGLLFFIAYEFCIDEFSKPFDRYRCLEVHKTISLCESRKEKDGDGSHTVGSLRPFKFFEEALAFKTIVSPLAHFYQYEWQIDAYRYGGCACR